MSEYNKLLKAHIQLQEEHNKLLIKAIKLVQTVTKATDALKAAKDHIDNLTANQEPNGINLN